MAWGKEEALVRVSEEMPVSWVQKGVMEDRGGLT